MRVLAIDTATEVLALCVEDGGSRASLALRRGLQHSPSLLPLADRLLGELGFGARDLDLVVCSVGPGSFTGIRIGLATAKGIAFATGCPLVGVSTLEALALPWAFFDGEVWPIIDARKGNWYTARFQAGLRTTGYLDLAPGDLGARLGAAPGRILLVGPDASKIASVIPGAVVSELFDPAAVLLAGMARYAAEGAPPASLSPLYLRQSEAEIAAGRHDGR